MADPQRVKAAMTRFRAFFEELGTFFFERDDVLHQIALALLCREHALITGPPGTAKSALASAVFGRIICEDSGEPSMYARQITESTVQTDLIGPIDFKNLMETGRTTHFTDEGMLGAAHAFLDEVFDGRDMLLRSALNVLQERELKQGTKVIRGRIECALMTTNRYIADVLEHARETLLAFVDRIAFIAFVPRGFARPSNMSRVLERHVTKASSARPDALLTIQDLDVLQEVVEEVHVSTAICGAVAALIDSIHVEVNQAARSDPMFVATRYLSTRTAVRSGQVLRAQAVYDQIFGNTTREAQVLPHDLNALRLHLMLGGPQPDEVATLLDLESDPSEKRQLEIVRSEREIFARCLGRLKKLKVKPLVSPSTKPTKKEKKKRKKEKEVDPLAGVADQLRSTDVPTLMATVRTLAMMAGTDVEHGPRAQLMLEDAIAALNRVVFHVALEASAEPGRDMMDAVTRLADLAESIEDDSMSMHGVSAWLRKRANEMIDHIARFAGGSAEIDLNAALGVSGDAAARTNARLDNLDRLARLRQKVQGAAAPSSLKAETGSSWDTAIHGAEAEIAVLWDAAFCRQVELLLAAQPDAPLSDVLSVIGAELSWLDEASQRLGGLRGVPSAVKRLAVGGRLGDLIAARMAGLTTVDRNSLTEEIDRVLEVLEPHKLGLAVAPVDWLRWCAEALVRGTAEAPQPEGPLGFDGYFDLREDEQRVPVAYTLSEIALRVAPDVTRSDDGAAADMTRVSSLLGSLPASLRVRAAAADIARLERSVDYLERWWASLAAGEMSAQERLDAIVKSRFFRVLWDDQTLARHALEATLVARTFVEEAEAARALHKRIDALETETRQGAHALLRARTDAAWQAALAATD